MSFIYQDKSLLEKLYRIAQAQPPVNNKQLDTVAKQLIDNLRSSTSGIKAYSNPTFTNLVDLPSFLDWMRDSGAQYQGQTALNTDGTPNKEVFSAILSDLRDKTAGKQVGYAEAVNNIIEQANRAYRLNLKPSNGTPVPPANEKNPDGTPKNQLATNEKPGPDGSKGQLGFSADQSTLDSVNALPQMTQPVNDQQKNTATQKLNLLDGRTVNFDDINGIMNAAVVFLKNQGPLYNRLWNSCITPLGSIHSRLNTLTGFAVGDVSITPGEGFSDTKEALKAALVGKTFTGMQMSAIAHCYYDLMHVLTTFYDILMTYPPFKPLSDDFSAQRNVADQYARSFIGAAGYLEHDNVVAIGGAVPR